MNGGENGYAGALFFALVSMGALLKIDEVFGWGIGAVGAVLAAICLKKAINASAMAAEEDHQRIEIQFQQLRSKIGESSHSNYSSTMASLGEASETVSENLQGIRSRLAELDNLPQISATLSEISESVKNFENRSEPAAATFRTISEAVQMQAESSKDIAEKSAKISETFETLSADVKTLKETCEESKSTLQTGLKLLQVFGQIMKAPAFTEDLKNICASVDAMIVKVEMIEDLRDDFAALAKNTGDIAAQNKSITDANIKLEESVRAITEKVDSGSAGLSEFTGQISGGAAELKNSLENMRSDIAKLTNKLDAYNGLMKATIEQYSTLTEQDVRVLERIAEKVNVK